MTTLRHLRWASCCFFALLICAPIALSQETQIRYGSVVKFDYKQRMLTMLNQSGGSIIRLKIAKDVEYRRLDDGPDDLKALKKGDRVRVEYEQTDSELPVATSILARTGESQAAVSGR